MQRMTGDYKRESAEAGLKMNLKETKVMAMKYTGESESCFGDEDEGNESKD